MSHEVEREIPFASKVATVCFVIILLFGASIRPAYAEDSFFQTLWCDLISVVGITCDIEIKNNVTEVTHTEDDNINQPAVVSSEPVQSGSSTTQIIRETPTYVTNEYITNPVIREVVREIVRENGGGSSSSNTNEFVSRTLFDNQVSATNNSIDNSITGINDSLAESISTGLLTVTGNTSLSTITLSSLTGGILTTDANGVVSTTTIGASSIVDNSLDFNKLANALTVDATTSFDLDTNSADLNFDSSTLFIDSSANRVGIGTTTPGYDFDVDGTVRATDIISKGPVLDVRAFGAVGDGVTDDTEAIQAAVDYAAQNNRTLTFPDTGSNYIISSTITISNNTSVGFGLVGNGTIEQTTNNTPLLHFSGTDQHGMYISGLTLTYTNTQSGNTSAICMLFSGTDSSYYNSIFTNLAFRNCHTGISQTDNDSYFWGNRIEQVYFYGNMYGPAIDLTTTSGGRPNNYFGNIYILALVNADTLIKISNQSNLTLENIEVNRINNQKILTITSSMNVLIRNIRVELGTFDQNFSGLITVSGTYGLQIDGYEIQNVTFNPTNYNFGFRDSTPATTTPFDISNVTVRDITGNSKFYFSASVANYGRIQTAYIGDNSGYSGLVYPFDASPAKVIQGASTISPWSSNALGALYFSASVGLGTSTVSHKLTVAAGQSDGIHLYDTTNLRSNYITNSSTGLSINASGSGLQLVTGGSERVRITSAGNVGIGTTTPGRQLTVTGAVGFSGLTGSSGAGSLCLSSAGEVVYNSGSDSCLPSVRELKNNIKELSFGTSTEALFEQLSPVSFIYNYDDTNRVRYGFIADEAFLVDEHLVTYNDEGDLSGLDTNGFLALIVDAVKDIYTKIAGFADSFTTKKLNTEEFCIGDTCIDETRFRELLEEDGVLPTVINVEETPEPDFPAETASTSEEVIEVEEVSGAVEEIVESEEEVETVPEELEDEEEVPETEEAIVVDDTEVVEVQQ